MGIDQLPQCFVPALFNGLLDFSNLFFNRSRFLCTYRRYDCRYAQDDTLADLSAIKISADANNKLGLGTSAVNVNYCVAFAYDYRAIGFTIDKMKITSNYTACADFWNEFTHIWTNAIIDTNLPMVAFILD